MKLELREQTPKYIEILAPIVAVLFSFVLGSILILSIGANPIATYGKLLFGSFRSAYSISEVIVKTTPLLLCGLAVMSALKVKFWNIGVEGQFCMGAWAAGGVALSLGHFPAVVLLPLLIFVGFIAGTLWGFIPTVLKVGLKVNEIITTLLMNYIAALWLNYHVYGSWKGRDGFPYTEIFSASASLPNLFGQRAHIGIFFGIIIAIIFQFFFEYTKFGYKIRITGENPKAARYAGMNVGFITIVVMSLSGGIAGLAGMVEVTGIHHRLHPNILLGYGYTGIIIAWLSKNNLLAVILVSALFGILAVGGDIIQIHRIPSAIVKILQGLIFFSVLAFDTVMRYRVKRDA
ncbi:MAG: ABC transporter permease [Candidatus Poribacteria bacterium]